MIGSKGAWNMHENAQKFDWKTQSKIACNYSMAKFASLDVFSEVFELEASSVEDQSLQPKGNKRKKKDRQKKKLKNEKPKWPVVNDWRADPREMVLSSI